MHVQDNKQASLLAFKSDCTACSGLCCIGLFFSKVDGFPENKAPGKACKHLQKDYRCHIHDQLAAKHCKGCIGYECFGAGQHVIQKLYHGKGWIKNAPYGKEMLEVFLVLFHLYQMRYFLTEVLTIEVAQPLWDEAQTLITQNENWCLLTPQEILKLEILPYKTNVNTVLKKACALVQAKYSKGKHTAVHYIGKQFKHKDFKGIDLSMQLLIGANFEGSTFKGSIFLGADTRDSDFRNADLSEAVFLSQGQINSAKGNLQTKLPAHLDYPVTWQ